MTKFYSDIKILSIVVASTLVMALSACSDDIDSPNFSDDVIRFHVVDEASRASNDGAPNTASMHLLECDECPDTLYMYMSMTDMAAPGQMSRGALNSEIGDFYMSCALNEGTSLNGYYFKNELYTPAGVNKDSKKFYWMNSGTYSYRFYGISPAPSSSYTLSYPADNQAPRISYNVSTDPDRQIDLLGVTTDLFPDTYKAVVPVKFKHLCTAITFRADASVFPGKIKKITLSGIASSGVYDMGTCTWTLNDATTSYIVEPNKDVDEDDTVITPDNEATFFLLPQTLGEGAKVVVEYENSVSHASYTLKADLDGSTWPMGKVITYVISTSGITARQSGLSIVGTAHSNLLPATISLKAYDDTEELLDAPISLSTPGFSIPGSLFLDNLIEKGLTGTRYYVVTVTNDDDTANTQELMVEFEFDYMAFTVDVDNTSKKIVLPLKAGGGVTPGKTPSTMMVCWDLGDFSDEFTQVTDANRSKLYATTGVRQIRIYSNLKGETAVPIYGYENVENFSERTISVDTKLLSSPNTSLARLFNNCGVLTSVPSSLFENFDNGKVVGVSHLFYSCYLLQELPAGIFDSFTKVTDFTGVCQYCRGLQTIPAGLFDKCTEATNMNQIFNGCYVLQSIPAGLFDHNTKVTSFGNAFQNCRVIPSIPEGLFDNCPDASDFSYVFNSCRALQSIPQELFYKTTKAEVFNFAFENCYTITEVPHRLFVKCPNAKQFSSLFKGCRELTKVYDDLFEGCSQAWNFYETFYGCSKLATVPAGLFQPCQGAKTFSNVFTKSGLTYIPSGLFANMRQCTDFSNAFEDCKSLQTFPDNLFADCSSAYEFHHLFAGCEALTSAIPVGFFQGCNTGAITSLERAFYNCQKLSGPLPADLFSGMTNLTTLADCFYQTKSLSSTIPSTLFADNDELSNMSNTFAFCNNLKGPIPSGLFDNCRNLTDMSRTFVNCNLLTAIPTDLFDNCPNINNFTDTFAHCYWISGKVPTLWLSYPDAEHASCFYRVGLPSGATESTVSNYNDIPESWRGDDGLVITD